ncbi:oligosaccharide repeat unit polymerase [Gordonia alkanivorans]|uniref:oligosaccharide repeat unit polymerase n=1 Tax=Gordonia alkanivorans TaxID=84096 RepID=UPI0012DFAB76|nr:oligosaccharide repeat unit polymerase [Gordonia alkanivorans]
MNDVSAALCLSLLVVLNIICLSTLVVIKRKRATLVTFQSLLVLVFWTSVPVSGVAHMINDDRGLGFYNLVDSLAGNVDFIRALLAATAGTIAICGTVSFMPSVSVTTGEVDGNLRALQVEQTNGTSLLLIGFGTMLLVPSVFSIIKIKTYAESTGMARVTLIEGGAAKYAFMSHWFAWAATFIAVGFICLPRLRGTWFRSAISLIAIASIAWSLSWSGGRSVLVIMTLPLIVVVAGVLKRKTWVVALPVGLVLAYLSARATSSRSEGYVNESAFSTLSLLDWQWGRFSMLGFGSRVVEDDGFLMGETLYAGLRTIPDAIAKLVLTEPVVTSARLSTAVTGEKLLGNADQRYIVPGLPAELYMNFGIVGVFVGLAFLSYLVTRAERQFTTATHVADRIFWSYLCVVLIFCTIPAHSAAILNYLVFSGAPVLVLPVLSKLYRWWRGQGSRSTNLALSSESEVSHASRIDFETNLSCPEEVLK